MVMEGASQTTRKESYETQYNYSNVNGTKINRKAIGKGLFRLNFNRRKIDIFLLMVT